MILVVRACEEPGPGPANCGQGGHGRYLPLISLSPQQLQLPPVDTTHVNPEDEEDVSTESSRAFPLDCV